MEHISGDNLRQVEDESDAAWDELIRSDFSPGQRGEQLLKTIQQEIADGPVESLTEGLRRRRNVNR